VDRYQADLTGVAELTDKSTLKLGARYFQDSANAVDTANEGIPAAIYYNGQSSITYNDIAGFAQYDLDTRWANLSIGGRYEYHGAVGGHFVPRVSLTKAWEKFYLKLLYSQASRIPGINVINSAISGNLEAEQTVNYELEAGYKFTDSLSWSANVFYMEVNKPIIYTAAAAVGGSSDGYYNGTKLSTAGLESELRWDQPQFSSSLNCSYYRAVDNDIAYVQGDPGNFLAAPSYKVAANFTWHINPKLDWNLNGFWLGEMMAYAYPAPGPTTLPSEFVLNTFLNYQFQHFSVGIGASNLLDEERYAPQPYAGGSGPMPLMGREFFAKLTFKF
jgi:outer membrane receptor for ferrienterochelin and colicin